MKSFIKNLIYKLIKTYKIDLMIQSVNDQRKIENVNNQITNNNALIFAEANVTNLQNDQKAITINKGSCLKGNLLTYKFGGKIEIGENTYIGLNTRIWSAESIRIGKNVLISHDVNIIDTNSHEVDHLERAERFRYIVEVGHWEEKQNIVTAPIHIKDDVWINFNVTILKGVTIGRGAIVGAGSVVVKDVPDFTLVAGNPAKVIKKLDA